MPSPELLFSSFTDMRPNWASRVFVAMILVLVLLAGLWNKRLDDEVQ